jgi:hypothetical protein
MITKLKIAKYKQIKTDKENIFFQAHVFEAEGELGKNQYKPIDARASIEHSRVYYRPTS